MSTSNTRRPTGTSVDEEEAFSLNPINGKESISDGAKSENKMEDEEIESFSDIVGNSGPYQRDILYLYIAIYLISAFQNYGITFYSVTPDFWCKSSENSTLIESSVNISRTTCTISPTDNAICQEWEYDHSFYRSTIVTEVRS